MVQLNMNPKPCPMKKFFFLVMFLLPATVMFGQFSFGLKLGANFSKMSTNIDTMSASMKPGFQIGAFVRFGKRFYVQPEVYYNLGGGSFTGDSTSWKQDIVIGSVDIPVLVGFKLLNAKIVNIRILGGPLVSFVTNTKVKDVNDITGPITSADLNNVNWGIQAGAGVDVLFLTLDIRYQWGLNDVIKEIGATTATANSKYNTWVISLGFKI
jgi:hypothetical protein